MIEPARPSSAVLYQRAASVSLCGLQHRLDVLQSAVRAVFSALLMRAMKL